MRRLGRSFYLQPTRTVARRLIGCTLCLRRGRRVERYLITETEAYLGLKDPACHSYHGKLTDRVMPMYEPGGTAYVYLIYGMYDCFNVVTRAQGVPEAVLVRAVYDVTETHHHRTFAGPGKLCRELKITRVEHNGLDLVTSKDIWIEGPRGRYPVETDRRVGVDYAKHAADWPLRFMLKGHASVSKKKQKPSA